MELEYIAVIILGILFLHQVAAPIIRGVPIFPALRKNKRLVNAIERKKEAQKLLEAARVEAQTARMEREAEQIRMKLYDEALKEKDNERQ